MNRLRILTILTWIAVIAMFAYIGIGLARQFDPAAVFAVSGPDYTKQSYEETEHALAECNLKLRMADDYIMDIVRPKGLIK